MSEPRVESGRVERLWVKRAKRGSMDAVSEVQFVARRGLAGNADAGGRRQVTILSRERWSELTHALGDVDPVVRRANVMVSGIELEATRGRLLQIGAATVRVNGETRPCRALDFVVEGLQRALDPRWGGGVYAEVIEGGVVHVDDVVQWTDAPEA
ncbi:MAG TPA: MOSC domain-containing protein [Acidimicrobiales bacterium]|nr:MOSC domain-containing protein [Acidimicrobiales bacterium]